MLKRRPTLYLASPYGFSAHWRSRLLPDFIEALEGLGLEVWEPFARNGQVDLAQEGWAWRGPRPISRTCAMPMPFSPSSTARLPMRG